MKNRPIIVKWIAMLVLFMACCLVSTSLQAQDSGQEGKEVATDDGRKMSYEAQQAMMEANRRITTDPENYTAAREPLIAFLASPESQDGPIPEMLYMMLGQWWYLDEGTKNHIEEAQKLFKAAYVLFPENETFLLYQAITTYNLEQFAAAAPLFEKYYEVSEDHDITHLNTAAGLYYAAEDLKNAKRIFLKMISLVEVPEEQWIETVIGLCQAEEDIDEAQKYIWLALKYYPTSKKYWTYLYGNLSTKEEYRSATAALEIASKVEAPTSESDWSLLIGLYNYLGLYNRSAESIQKGLDLLAAESSEEEQQLAVAEAYARSTRVDKAVAYLDSVIAKSPSYNLKFKKADILYEARRNKAALVALDECIAENPRAYEAYYRKGWIAWDMKDWDAAERAFEVSSASKDDLTRVNSKNCLEMIESLNEAKRK